METQPVTVETQVRNSLETPYVTAVKAVVRERIPDQAGDFDRFFDGLNNELMGNGEGKGFFIWESKKYPGVKFLAGHIRITEAFVRDLSGNESEEDHQSSPQRRERLVRFIQPALGSRKDGSAISAVDMAFSPAIDMANTIATSIKNGDASPVGDIFLLGGLTAIGGGTTEAFNQAIKEASNRGEGFDPYGEIYAEFMEENLPKTSEELDKVRVVLEGVSKGTITADRTYAHLSDNLKSRKVKIEIETEGGEKREIDGERGVQVLLDNPAGVHGHNLPTQIGRGANMLLFLAEAGIRSVTSKTGRALGKTQPQFYLDIARKLGIAEDDGDQKKLKGDLTRAEFATLWHGTKIDKDKRTYVRVSSPDTANSNFKAVRRALGLKDREDLGIQDFMISESEMKIFPNKNTLHMWPWLRSIDSGSWARKMKAIVAAK
jgi:hypothetical protein